LTVDVFLLFFIEEKDVWLEVYFYERKKREKKSATSGVVVLTGRFSPSRALTSVCSIAMFMYPSKHAKIPVYKIKESRGAHSCQRWVGK
jgi:hypothetical protein